ncbi:MULTISPECIES: hypothetical protein [Bacteroides]|uniref:hypothetical protein n=1 Tax=Bacteroides TaxID=816 RepID=UPI001F402EF1|nr:MULTISPECIES: hypothetical protein [Bacteroides]
MEEGKPVILYRIAEAGFSLSDREVYGEIGIPVIVSTALFRNVLGWKSGRTVKLVGGSDIYKVYLLY